MRIVSTIRVLLYLLAGSATALWLLSFHAYRGEWTIVDQMHSRREGSTRQYTARVDCGWRVLMCKEIPPVVGAVAGTWDSASAGIETFECMRILGALNCQAAKGDTVVRLLVDPTDSFASVSRSWALSGPGPTYDQLVEGLTRLYGEARVCPQSDDMMFTEDRKWQLEGRYVGIVKVGGPRIELSTGEGKSYCHVGP